MQSELTSSLLLLFSSRRRKRLAVRLLSFRPCPRPLLSSCISLRSRITSSWPVEDGKSIKGKDEEVEEDNRIEGGKALDSTLTSSSLLDTLHQINIEPERCPTVSVFHRPAVSVPNSCSILLRTHCYGPKKYRYFATKSILNWKQHNEASFSTVLAALQVGQIYKSWDTCCHFKVYVNNIQLKCVCSLVFAPGLDINTRQMLRVMQSLLLASLAGWNLYSL